LRAEADTYTSSLDKTSTAAGSSTTLRANRAGSDTAFLRFDLSALQGKTITSATLKLHSANVGWAGSNATFDAWLVAATQWKEAYMSFENTEPISTRLLGSLVAPTRTDTAYDVTLNPAVVQPKAGAKLSMAINSRTTDVLVFYAREAGADLAPELIVNYK
jgi:hypothetical protein